MYDEHTGPPKQKSNRDRPKAKTLNRLTKNQQHKRTDDDEESQAKGKHRQVGNWKRGTRGMIVVKQSSQSFEAWHRGPCWIVTRDMILLNQGSVTASNLIWSDRRTGNISGSLKIPDHGRYRVRWRWISIASTRPRIVLRISASFQYVMTYHL